MAQTEGRAFEELVERLDRELLPFAGRAAYGNLRRKVTEWGEGDNRTQNLAVIYESPGGSTNQLNIACREGGTFVTVDPESGAETSTDSIDELLELVSRHVDTVPGYRLDRLKQQIDEWVSAGYEQPHLFSELNQLLQSDFKGGSITQEELEQGLRYAVEALRSR